MSKICNYAICLLVLCKSSVLLYFELFLISVFELLDTNLLGSVCAKTKAITFNVEMNIHNVTAKDDKNTTVSIIQEAIHDVLDLSQESEVRYLYDEALTDNSGGQPFILKSVVEIYALCSDFPFLENNANYLYILLTYKLTQSVAIPNDQLSTDIVDRMHYLSAAVSAKDLKQVTYVETNVTDYEKVNFPKGEFFNTGITLAVAAGIIAFFAIVFCVLVQYFEFRDRRAKEKNARERSKSTVSVSLDTVIPMNENKLSVTPGEDAVSSGEAKGGDVEKGRTTEEGGDNVQGQLTVLSI